MNSVRIGLLYVMTATIRARCFFCVISQANWYKRKLGDEFAGTSRIFVCIRCHVFANREKVTRTDWKPELKGIPIAYVRNPYWSICCNEWFASDPEHLPFRAKNLRYNRIVLGGSDPVVGIYDFGPELVVPQLMNSFLDMLTHYFGDGVRFKHCPPVFVQV